ncbi:MAG: hypothetical protein IPJ18_18605 [Betaproteobacteria bacterium]|nr:hypothetical protein [Betaproteobacteria bacterium]
MKKLMKYCLSLDLPMKKRRICAAVILMGLIMMVSELLEQQQTRPTGRWAFFLDPFGICLDGMGLPPIGSAFQQSLLLFTFSFKE